MGDARSEGLSALSQRRSFDACIQVLSCLLQVVRNNYVSPLIVLLLYCTLAAYHKLENRMMHITVPTGVWLRPKEVEISNALCVFWLEQDFI